VLGILLGLGSGLAHLLAVLEPSSIKANTSWLQADRTDGALA